MDNLWGYILSATIYGSITGIVILLIKILLKNKINKKYGYLLWMILIIKLVFPFGPESSLSIFNKIPVKINSQVNMNSINSSNMDENLNYTVDTEYENISNESSNQKEISTSQNLSSTSTEYERNTIKNVIPIIWMSGAILALTSHMIIYLYFIKNLRKKHNYKYDYLDYILEECKEKLHIKRKIHIVIDNTINSPSLVGVFKSRIIIPSSLIKLSKEELQHIFLHELCHFKRKDILTESLLVLLQCVHWFNPLVWYLFKHVRNDMEMACDERVLSILNEKDHNKYGLTMLTVLEKANFNKKLAIGLNMADDKKTIKKRVELIKNSKYFTKKNKIFTITGVACLIIMCGVLLTNGKVINEDDKKLLATEKTDLQDLDQAISKAIIDNYIKDVYGGELKVQSHVVLGKKEIEDSIEVYIMATYGAYSFENNIFSMTSGSSNIPIRIKFSKIKEDKSLTRKVKYYYIESEEAQDGALYKDSVLKMFPKKEALQALSINYTSQLLKDINKQAELYVKSIGRKCEVTYEYVEHEYIEELDLVDREQIKELSDYPDWIGTKELLINNKRYIYETQYDKFSKVIIFTKYNENKDILEFNQYKINGNKLEKLDHDSFILYSNDMAPIFIENEDFKITVKSISIINNNAEFGVCIENKTSKIMDISMDKINIGESSKYVEFNTKLKSKETKYANLKIKNISKISELHDKLHGTFSGSSSKYDFIFKY